MEHKMAILPLDNDSNPIPVLRLKTTGGAHAVAATATSARNATAFNANTRVVSVYATGAVYLRFGGSTVTAANTDHYFPAGVYYDFAIGGDKVGLLTNLAVLRVDTDCTVYISEKE
jgi:nicotinic acid phosphoribosyltransferase